MKKLPPYILIVFLFLYSCEAANSDESKTKFNPSEVVKGLPGKNVPQAIEVDSARWMNGTDSMLKLEEEILYLNTRWEIINKESFLDSVLISNYGSIVLINSKLEKAQKLKKIISFEGKNDPISQDLVKYDNFSLTGIPDSLFRDLNGTIINNTILDKKIVVLNFWFIGCKGCMQEIPHLNNLVDKYRNNKEVIFLAASTDTPTELTNFSLTTRFKYRLVSVNDNILPKGTFKISTFPTNMIIGKDGKVKYFSSGGSAVAVKWLDLAIEKVVNIEKDDDL